MFGGVRRTTGSRANSEHSSRTGRVYFALTIVFTARRPQGAPLSALFTPPSKVSSPLSKRIPLHTLENDICPLFSPPPFLLSKVSSPLSRTYTRSQSTCLYSAVPTSGILVQTIFSKSESHSSSPVTEHFPPLRITSIEAGAWRK